MSLLFDLLGLKDPHKSKHQQEQQEVACFMNAYSDAQHRYHSMQTQLELRKHAESEITRTLTKACFIPHLEFLLGACEAAHHFPKQYSTTGPHHRGAHDMTELRYRCVPYDDGVWLAMEFIATRKKKVNAADCMCEIVHCPAHSTETLVNVVQLHRMLKARIFSDGETMALFSICPDNQLVQQTILFQAYHDGLIDVYSTGRVHVTSGRCTIKMERHKHIGRVTTAALMQMFERVILDNPRVFPSKLRQLIHCEVTSDK